MRRKSAGLEQNIFPTDQDMFEYIRGLNTAALRFTDPAICGILPDILKLERVIPYLRKSKLNVLITGETGTGKELIAQSLKGGLEPTKFMAINCAGFNENLIASELFGHVKNAFTGADKDKVGILKELDGGTLFLDELGILPVELQAQLLRAIQNHEFRKVGSNKIEKLKNGIRVIAATNESEKLRPDLRWRFEKHIHIPPLRSHIVDVFIIMQSILDNSGISEDVEWRFTSHTFIQLLYSQWEGNVRELKNSLDNSIAKHQFYKYDRLEKDKFIIFEYDLINKGSELLDHNINTDSIFQFILERTGLPLDYFSHKNKKILLEKMDSELLKLYVNSTIEAEDKRDVKMNVLLNIPDVFRLMTLLMKVQFKTKIHQSDNTIFDIKRVLTMINYCAGDLFVLPPYLSKIYENKGQYQKHDIDEQLDLTHLTEDELLAKYWNQLNDYVPDAHGRQKKISEMSGCSKDTVRNRFKKYTY